MYKNYTSLIVIKSNDYVVNYAKLYGKFNGLTYNQDTKYAFLIQQKCLSHCELCEVLKHIIVNGQAIVV